MYIGEEEGCTWPASVKLLKLQPTDTGKTLSNFMVYATRPREVKGLLVTGLGLGTPVAIKQTSNIEDPTDVDLSLPCSLP